MNIITPVILSGGAGSRLWPLSTQMKPKQFHALNGSNTMFGDTLQRVRTGQLISFGPPMVVCGIDHEAQVRIEFAKASIVGGQMVLEPMPRNTAPALAAAALVQCEQDGEALMLVLPADHVITRPQGLHQACINAYESAISGKIVTFAIKPFGPETGYGYIKQDAALNQGVFSVEAFREKPDVATAQGYIDDGSYAWNAGIFYFKASAFIAELERHTPEILRHAREAVRSAVKRDGVILLDPTAFGHTTSISVDYAIMEKTSHAAVVPVDIGWSDVGSFAALWELANKDNSGNSTQGNVVVFDSSSCYVKGGDIPIALIGVSDLVVVTSPQGILVTKRERAQDVRLAALAFE